MAPVSGYTAQTERLLQTRVLHYFPKISVHEEGVDSLPRMM